MVETTEKQAATPPDLADLGQALSAGVLLLQADGGLAGADERALALLGCGERGELARRVKEIGPQLMESGEEALSLPVGAEGRPVCFEVHRLQAEAGRGAVVLVRDPEALASAAADFRLATYFRVLSQLSPAVAHDLRAPINAMVFNLEILKETIAGSKILETSVRDRQLRYVSVLKEELSRLHTELEHFLSHTSGRGDRDDKLDLREMVQELAALLVPQARKLQVQVVPELPDHPVTVHGNRFQLRQALLEVGLAALSGIARAGTLGIRLENGDRRARLLLAGPPSPEAPALDFSLAPGAPPTGCARLYHARAILAEQGGGVTVGGGAPGSRGFEVELPISGKE